MEKTLAITLAVFSFTFATANAAVEISIDAAATAKTYSPCIYGKNGTLSQETGKATSADTLALYKDLGLKMLRLNNGNNASKYNYEKHMTSHPDWYNNVYDVDWDQSAKDLVGNLPGVQGMFAISMLGWTANDKTHNFNDWLYNQSNWSSDASQNWAGTPAISAAGEKPTATADPTLYLKQTTPDWEAGILTHFFGTGSNDLGLNKNQLLYWNMDNESDIWDGTHDDVMPDTMDAEEYVQIYVTVAKKARALYPDIKLVGPVTTNEWQWYNWHGNQITASDGNKYTFLEYFIKRIAEEEKSSGIRLLDVVDLHFYPGYSTESTIPDILQLHRIWFDSTYVFPYANAVKWTGLENGSAGKEYIFKRIQDWLTKYMGTNNGRTLGLSEFGAIDGAKNNPSAIAVWYASTLGEFAAAGNVELFTPWTWYNGMCEALHLFTHYAKEESLPAIKSDSLLSAYTTVNAAKDSMTVILVNRNMASSSNVNVTLKNFKQYGNTASTYTLSNLSGESFKSESDNAIKTDSVNVSNETFSITLPALSVTAVVLNKTGNTGLEKAHLAEATFKASAADGFIYLELPKDAESATLFDIQGHIVQSWKLGSNSSQTLNASKIPEGRYLLNVRGLGSRPILIQ